MPKSRARAINVSDATLLQLDNQLCFALHSTSRIVIRKYHAALDAVGITYPQYLVLLVLWEWESVDFPSPNYLALGKRLDFDSGTLTPLLNRMEASGLIKRAIPAHDKRERHIRLTAAGRALKKKLRRRTQARPDAPYNSVPYAAVTGPSTCSLSSAGLKVMRRPLRKASLPRCDASAARCPPTTSEFGRLRERTHSRKFLTWWPLRSVSNRFEIGGVGSARRGVCS